MRFVTVELDDAVGCVLVHSLRLPNGRLAKGTVLTAANVEAMRVNGLERVTALRPDEGDMLEDDAAAAIAAVVAGANIRRTDAATGRVNFHATANGLFVAERELINQLNRIDPAITVATLADHVAVEAGDMVATVKIIPLAVPRSAVEKAVDVMRPKAPFALKPFRSHRVLLIATELPSLKTSVMDRTAQLLQRRLDLSGSKTVTEVRIPHEAERLAKALRQGLTVSEKPDLVIIFGASAVADPQDVIPHAIRAAGGKIEQVGMPVDPGNLLVLGWIGNVPVVGAPGCARSPKENGFDWVLNRILAGERPTAEDITGMGVGGLLMEIASRPQPREVASRPDLPVQVGAVLLAAGQARRMGEGGPHKLLAEFGGVPLVRRSAQVLLASKANPTVVVTGHRREEIDQTLRGLDLTTVFNADYADGLGTSLATSLSLPAISRCDGLLVMLADMPGVTSEHVDELISAFQEAGGNVIVRASHRGKRGNPIILPRVTFEDVRRIQGDIGARAIIENSGLPIIDIDIGAAAHLDVDTPGAVTAAGGILKR